MSKSCRSASYPRGVSPEARRDAMRCQVDLLQKAMASWPRRQAPLLEINCGNGAFLPLLWQWGFDAQASEACGALRQKAQRRHVPGLQVQAAEDTDLPYDNDAFDWVILHLINADAQNIALALQESLRVAQRGFMVTFWNSTSLPALLWAMRSKKPWLTSAIAWHQVHSQVRALGVGRITSFAALGLPVCAWHMAPLCRMAFWPPLAGAWCIIRLDLAPAIPATPLPLRLASVLDSPQAAMEYSRTTDNRRSRT